jgi:cell division protein FtsL
MEGNNRRYQQFENRTSYVEGSTVRKLSAVPDIRREEPVRTPVPRRQPQPERRQVPERQEQRQPRMMSGISMASMLVLAMAITATLYFCVQYLMLQYDVNTLEKDIVTMEHTLTTMKNENDAAYAQVDAVYDLDYVYRVAVGELGMVYPNKNTVITYQGKDEGYVRQYQDIPK